MRKWGNKSLAVYLTLDKRLQEICDYLLQNVADISLVTGYRGEAEQNAKFAAGLSKVRWPEGKHNRRPSIAVDLQPYPVPERTEKLWAALAYVAGRAIEYAKARGITLRWGGDWNRNGDLSDQNFDDLYHLEIVESESSDSLTPAGDS